MKTRVTLLLGAACSAILFSTAAVAQSAYSALQLSSGNYFTSMNNSGQLVGMDTTAGYVYTDANGLGLHTLATPAGYMGVQGFLNPAINNLGQVAGAYAPTDGSNNLQGFYTTTSGSVVSTSANGELLPAINALNDQGQMAGFYNNGTSVWVASQGGASWQPLSTLSANSNNYAITGINNQGQMSGVDVSSGAGVFQSFFASPDGSTFIKPIDLLYGTEMFGVNSRYLNDKGQLVGTYLDKLDNKSYAYLTGRNGHGLAVLDGVTTAMGLNNAGQVAGTGTDANGNFVAVITGDNGVGVIDVNTLYSIPGDTFATAQAINDRGQILVFTASNEEYLLTPVPEASTGALMLLGLCGLGLVHRRKH